MGKEAILEFLYGLQMFGIKLGLENIHTLLHSVDNPQNQYGIIHVAGTNGKGSVCTFLRAILMAAGYRVGTYTSPHLHQFNERITVDNCPIDDDELASLVDELRSGNPDVSATFFEFTTALALLHFSRSEVDVVVLEVGMGGRLDATNVVTPLVSVITSVSIDHGGYLGDSIEQIAAEKGGIIKAGVPVVISSQQEAVQSVLLRQADDAGALAFLYGRDFHCENGSDEMKVVSTDQVWTELRPQMLGRHQGENLATALMTLQCLLLHGYEVTQAQIRTAVAQATWPGRLEWWPDTHPPVLLDGAHNEAGATSLATYLQQHDYTKIRWVAGFKVDKDVAAILRCMLSLTLRVYAVEPPVEQPFPCEQIVDIVVASGGVGQSYADGVSALQQAQRDCRAGEIVVVAGSLFLVAACREYLILSR